MPELIYKCVCMWIYTHIHICIYIIYLHNLFICGAGWRKFWEEEVLAKKGQEDCVPKANLKKLFSEESEVHKCPIPPFCFIHYLKAWAYSQIFKLCDFKIIFGHFQNIWDHFPLEWFKELSGMDIGHKWFENCLPLMDGSVLMDDDVEYSWVLN